MRYSLILGLFGLIAAMPLDLYGTTPLDRRTCTNPVSRFFNPSSSDWKTAGTGDWLTRWMQDHQYDISSNKKGFSGAFGTWALGAPEWNCWDDGDRTSCGTNEACDSSVMNRLKDWDMQSAYHVVTALTRVRAYFAGLGDAFQTASIAAALARDGWANEFYEGNANDAIILFWKNFAVAAATGLTVAATFTTGVGVVLSGAAASGIAALISNSISPHANDVFEQSAGLGLVLASVVKGTVKGLTDLNNQLMKGEELSHIGRIDQFLSDGSWMDFNGVDKNAVVDSTNRYFVTKAVNYLWRRQKIFILGGGPCDDSGNIGSGPQEAKWCDQENNQAWYLYKWWDHRGLPTLAEKKWGHVGGPNGDEKISSDREYGPIPKDHIIRMSVENWKARGMRNRKPEDDYPWQDWTIPVCNVQQATYDSWADSYPRGRQYILEQYGANKRPIWCGPICSNNEDIYAEFVDAANMWGFESPRRHDQCSLPQPWRRNQQ